MIATLIDTYHPNFEPVIRRLASHLGLKSIRVDSQPETDMDWGSSSMILTRNEKFLNIPLIAGAATKKPAPYHHVRPWTDDYTSLLPLLELKGWKDPKVAAAFRIESPQELDD